MERFGPESAHIAANLMFPFRKILFPVDYSAPCEAVVPYVKEMVKRFSADLSLVHAYGPEALAYSELAITSPDLAEDVRVHEDRRLRKFAIETFFFFFLVCFAELCKFGSVLYSFVHLCCEDFV
jgi:hypothetical protein